MKFVKDELSMRPRSMSICLWQYMLLCPRGVRGNAGKFGKSPSERLQVRRLCFVRNTKHDYCSSDIRCGYDILRSLVIVSERRVAHRMVIAKTELSYLELQVTSHYGYWLCSQSQHPTGSSTLQRNHTCAFASNTLNSPCTQSTYSKLCLGDLQLEIGQRNTS